MIKSDIMVLHPEDLLERFRNRYFSRVKLHMFKLESRLYETVSVIMYCDTKLNTKILKNRFGCPGIILPDDQPTASCEIVPGVTD